MAENNLQQDLSAVLQWLVSTNRVSARRGGGDGGGGSERGCVVELGRAHVRLDIRLSNN